MLNDERQITNDKKWLSSLKSGFTLVEMLVVMAVIALIVSMIIAQVSSARARARDAEREQKIKSIQNALAIYAATSGKYPPSNQSLLPYAEANLTGADPISQDLVNSGAIPTTPQDPVNSGNYIFKYKSDDGTGYEISYYLETDSITGKLSSQNPQKASP